MLSGAILLKFTLVARRFLLRSETTFVSGEAAMEILASPFTIAASLRKKNSLDPG